MNTLSPRLVSFLLSACVWMILLAPARAVASNMIEMGPDSPGVRLIGKATTGKLRLNAEMQEKLGLTDLAAINLGVWSKINSEESAAEFIPEIPSEGMYNVYARWSTQPLRARVAEPMRLIVRHAGGDTTFQFAEDSRLGWIFLGAYLFKPGTGGLLRADANGSRGASAILGVSFEPVSDPEKTLGHREAKLPIVPGQDDEFDRLRLHAARLFTASAEGDLNNPEIAQAVAQQGATSYLLWKSMIREPGQVNLWSDLPTHQGKPIDKNEGGGWPLTRTFERVAMLASAYVRSNAEMGFANKMQGNPELLKDILFALEWLYQNRYNERSKNKYGAEWIGMEVTNPTCIAKTLLLLYPEVPEELLKKEVATMQAQSPGPDKFYGQHPATGFNLFNGIYAFTLRSILTKNEADMDRIAGLLSTEYQSASRAQPIVRGGLPGAVAGDVVGEDSEEKSTDEANSGKKKAKGTKSKSSADGYYADGSFIQHGNLPYIGIYGRGMLERFGQIQALLKESRWEINDPRVQIFYDMVYRGYAPLFFGGEIMSGSLGRSTGQSWHQNGTVSSEILNALIPMIDGAPPQDAARLRAIFRYWLLGKKSAAYPEFSRLDLRKITPANFLAMLPLLSDDTVIPEAPAQGTKIYHNSDYVIHHQPEFAAQLRMFSTRIRTHEDINEGTNRLGWYQGFGTLFVYNRDNSRYHDNFWATVNPYRLPGTTVDTRPRETPGARNGDLSTSPWAGGVQVDRFGLASMELQDPGSSLQARKSWVFLDDQIVCLGSGISSQDGRTIETIVENAKLHGGPADYPFVVDGKEQPAEPGWNARFEKARWAHLGGKVPGTDLGWIFPGGSDVLALREVRKGKWTDSFVKDADAAEHERTFLTLWYDHGSNPADQSYAHVILPGKTARQIEALSAQPEIEIVENSPKFHAVRLARLGVTAVNFWQAGEVVGLQSSAPASVMVVSQGKRLSVGLADPTQLADAVEIALPYRAEKVETADPSVKVVSLDPVRLKFDMKNSDGRTLTVVMEQ